MAEKADGPGTSLADGPDGPSKTTAPVPEKPAVPAPAKPAPEKPAPATAAATQPAAPAAPEVKKPEPAAPATTAGSPIFKTPEAAMAALAEKIAAKDFANFSNLVGPGGIPDADREAVKALVESPGFKLDPGKPQVEVSKSTDGLRWAFNFVPPRGRVKKRQLYVDLKSMPDASVDVSKVSLPLEIAGSRGAGAPTDPAGAPSGTATHPCPPRLPPTPSPWPTPFPRR